MSRTVVVHPEKGALAAVTAARLIVRLVDVQALRRPAHVALTGGSVGIAVLEHLAASSLRDAVDWTGVHLWWGDERFLPSGDPERNETQARQALLDTLPIPPENVHPMPGPGSTAGVDSPESAAELYAAELARFASGPGDGSRPGPLTPVFDVVLLGMGPDGHVASLFPGLDGVHVTDSTVIGVRGSPKPPPERVSLTLPVIQAADEVWIVVAGAEKAEAAARALAEDDISRTPAAGARGHNRTLWLLDVAAAG